MLCCTMQGCDAIHAMLVNPPCSIRSLTLDNATLDLLELFVLFMHYQVMKSYTETIGKRSL